MTCEAIKPLENGRPGSRSVITMWGVFGSLAGADRSFDWSNARSFTG